MTFASTLSNETDDIHLGSLNWVYLYDVLVLYACSGIMGKEFGVRLETTRTGSQGKSVVGIYAC